MREKIQMIVLFSGKFPTRNASMTYNTYNNCYQKQQLNQHFTSMKKKKIGKKTANNGLVLQTLCCFENYFNFDETIVRFIGSTRIMLKSVSK